MLLYLFINNAHVTFLLRDNDVSLSLSLSLSLSHYGMNAPRMFDNGCIKYRQKFRSEKERN